MKTTRLFLLSGCFALASLLITCSKKGDADNDTPYVIGEFRDGGVVFYIDASGKHGLVSAVTDQSAFGVWCESETKLAGADGVVLGTGAQNTVDIVAGCSTPGSAADICSELTLGGFKDWFLPSKDELYEMYLNAGVINTTAMDNGGAAFATDNYWTSTEFDSESATSAYILSFEHGISGNLTKFGTARVRAIRKF